MIDPKTIAIHVPCADGKLCWETAQGLLVSGGLYSGCSFMPGCSEVNLVRNIAAAQFLSTNYEWFVNIDSDVGFTRRDFEYLMDGDELAVYAPYAKKDGSQTAAEFGLGFARIHRSVFEKMLEHKSEDGTPSINHFYWRSHMCYEFYPSFANAAHHWSGEDHSFWKLVMMVGVTPRKETRCVLRHYGMAAFVLPPSAANEPARKLRCRKLIEVGDVAFQCEHDDGHAGACVTTKASI